MVLAAPEEAVGLVEPAANRGPGPVGGALVPAVTQTAAGLARAWLHRPAAGNWEETQGPLGLPFTDLIAVVPCFVQPLR
jgi:hypothetical protein